MRTAATIAALFLSATTLSAHADDWTAVSLRGIVMQFDGAEWVHLERGDIVSDARHIRTLPSGRVDFVRGQERISMAGDTDITINDAKGRKMTTVNQMFGAVTIEAERQNVQHFSVQTPVLAAVVKGTQFTVTYRDGQAKVEVDRGVVQVTDGVHDVVADVTIGQTARSSEGAVLAVSGPRARDVVYDVGGKTVPAAQMQVVAKEIISAQSNGTDRGNSNAGGNGKGNGSSGSGNSNAGGNGNGNGNSGSGNSNAGGNGKGNGSSGSGNSNAGGNGNGNGNAGGNGKGNGNSGSGNSNAGGNGNGNGNSGSGNSNAGGNGNGNGKGHNK